MLYVEVDCAKCFDGWDKKGRGGDNKCIVLFIPYLPLMSGVGVMDSRAHRGIKRFLFLPFQTVLMCFSYTESYIYIYLERRF